MNTSLHNQIDIANLKPNPDWAELPIFDRSGWENVRFGDVVECVNETCDPSEAGVERFIGLEHLEPGSLHVREWGNVADGTTFTRRCRPGQVLFGKRRAYQRKVAVAEFDAVVSGDIYVLTPKGDRLLSELLPFICMSERFLQFAVETSAGSLSPRTNWSHLSQFEFALPPLDQQRRIAEILWAVDSVMEQWRAVEEHSTMAASAYASELTLPSSSEHGMKLSAVGSIPSHWECVTIGELTASSAYGPRFPGSLYDQDGNVRTIRTTDFDRSGGIIFSAVPAARLSPDRIESHLLVQGDFLLSRSGEYAGLTAVFEDPGDDQSYIPSAFVIRYRFEGKLDPQFLLILCYSRYGDEFVKPLANGSAQPNIAGSAFAQLPVPLPPLTEQRRIVEKVRELAQARSEIQEHFQISKRLLETLRERWTA